MLLSCPLVRVAGVILALASPVAAQVGAGDTLFTVERYLDYETVATPRISPDGVWRYRTS